jgi:hypothetical protein
VFSEIDISLRRLDENAKAESDKTNPMIFPIDSEPYDLPYNKWTGKWWQWALGIPAGINPLTDNTGQYCAEGQSGPVWFLAGTTCKTYSSKRNCIIPSGKAILFPIIVSQFSFSEIPFIKTDEELISYTAKDIDQCTFLEAAVDGVKLYNLYKYRVQFGPFELSLPSDNIWNVRPGVTMAVSDGFWVFLKPLNDGDHTINFHGIEPNFHTEVTYHITVRRQM